MTRGGASLAIEALVTLKAQDAPGVGRERIRLLEAVAREGSITAAARSVGLTYKAAWDALDAMTNLFGQPLLEKRAGGRAGGGATLTPTGMRIVQAFRKLEAEMARTVRAIEPELAGTGISPLNLVSGLLMKTSARNALRGTISRMVSDTLSTEVAVSVTRHVTLHALVTNESVSGLGLFVGRRVIALVKAPFVMIATGDPIPALSVRNRVSGIVRRCEASAVTAEVVLDIGGDMTLAATITAQSARDLDLAPGRPAFALFDAAHVILAVD
jgi:molybdate transport system regulatory protein